MILQFYFWYLSEVGEIMSQRRYMYPCVVFVTALFAIAKESNHPMTTKKRGLK